jgi:DNA topoisomerase-2
VERLTQPMYVLNNDNRIIEREITFTPGLFKIFDEIVVNAADNKQRDPNMDKIDVVVDPESNSVSVKNNGKGIPIVMHKEHNVYVPTLIFGHLLTGSVRNVSVKAIRVMRAIRVIGNTILSIVTASNFIVSSILFLNR